MKTRYLHNAALLLAVGVGSACSVSTASPAADPQQSGAANRSAAVPSIDPAALKAAVSDDAVRALYQRTGWHALWSDANAAALDAAIGHRGANGLDRIDFGNADAGSDAAAKDVARSKVALAYAKALADGIVDPSSLHDVYTIPRANVDYTAGLAHALQTNRVGDFFAELVPQDPDYQRLSDAYVRYATQKSQGRSSKIADDETIHPGDRDPRLADVAAQLSANGYIPQDVALQSANGQPPQYGEPLIAGVKKLQADYGIKTDGLIGSNTLAVINTGPADKARALAVALERRRWLSRTPPATRIDINAASAMLTYYRDGKVVDERRVIVGKPGRETPPLRAPIYRLVANPTWTVPHSIHVSSATVRAKDMHWSNGFLVQPSGPKNALGLVKFDMQDDQAIYLHDTSDHSLFDRTQRDLSHGCVRVQDALGFAQMLAKQEGIEPQWQQARGSGEQTFVPLPKPIPVRLLYWNAFVDSKGEIAFRTDPYGWNDTVAKALGFQQGSSSKARAQDIDIGP